jgi:hypothetical protein
VPQLGSRTNFYILQPRDALLGVDIDAGSGARDETCRNPTNDILPIRHVGVRTIIGKRYPGVPRRYVVNVEEAVRLRVGSPISQVCIGEID